jgi:AcrR family transcriptional regulator
VARTEQLQPADWAQAALEAIAERGIGALSVERLASRLGVSKGSFYWHFPDRAALVEAAALYWEETGTAAGQRVMQAIEDPGERLRRLFGEAFAYPRAGQIEAALTAHVNDPVVGPIIRRVTESRLAFTTRAFLELGFERPTARHRALIAYSAYLGMFAVRRADGRALATRRTVNAYLAELLTMLAAPAD